MEKNEHRKDLMAMYGELMINKEIIEQRIIACKQQLATVLNNPIIEPEKKEDKTKK